MSRLTKPETPDRSKINLQSEQELKYWTRALGISKDELRSVIEKVGNAAAAVRKEIASAKK
jgi:Protein of unknown function (DUF3606)